MLAFFQGDPGPTGKLTMILGNQWTEDQLKKNY